ncbi:MAG: hypothetical protein HQ517_02320, partial [SAR324 cluster bacterium]|nr:hypothetical protein [SAR324 cluster bacterium]
MINKMVSSLITALVLLFCLNQTASAGELFGVGVSYIYLPQDDSQNIDSMSGRIVYLTLPLFFGVGQEEYNFSFKDGAGRNLGFDVDMKDIYF